MRAKSPKPICQRQFAGIANTLTRLLCGVVLAAATVAGAADFPHTLTKEGAAYRLTPLLSSADVGIENNGVVQVVLETTNFPISGVVQVRYAEKYSATEPHGGFVTATYTSGTFTQALWSANLTFAPGFTTLQARATVP